MATAYTPKRNPSQAYFNAFARWLLRSPLHGMLSGKLMLIEVVGRKSGKTYVIPIAYGEHDGDVLMGVAKAGWLRNLAPDRTVTLTVRGRRFDAYPELLTDAESVAELAAHIVRGNRMFEKFQQLRLAADGKIDRDDVRAALAGGFTLVRLRPAD